MRDEQCLARQPGNPSHNLICCEAASVPYKSSEQSYSNCRTCKILSHPPRQASCPTNCYARLRSPLCSINLVFSISLANFEIKFITTSSSRLGTHISPFFQELLFPPQARYPTTHPTSYAYATASPPRSQTPTQAIGPSSRTTPMPKIRSGCSPVKPRCTKA